METRILDWAGGVYPGMEMREAQPGRVAAVHLGEPGREYEAFTRRVGLVLSPEWAPILVEGPDAAGYLHRRLSQSIEGLAVGRGAHALQLGGDGRMQAELLVYRGADGIFVLTEARFAEASAELIEKYVFAEQVTVRRTWATECVVGLAGPAAPRVLRELAEQPPEGLAPDWERGRWAGPLALSLGGLACRAFGDGRWNVPYYHLCFSRADASEMVKVLEEACRREGGQAVGELACELARMEAGIARFGVDTTERTIPLEAGLVGAISFGKGCYPGQEIIARITNLGHPARELVRLSMAGERKVEPGAPVFVGDQEAGAVTSAVTWGGLGRTEALGYLKWEAREAAEIEIRMAAGSVAARVGPLKGGNE